MDLGAADLDLLMNALVNHRPPGRAAQVLDLAGRLDRELIRQRVVADEFGPPSKKKGLVLVPGGKDRQSHG